MTTNMPMVQQTAVVQADRDITGKSLPLVVSSSASIPRLSSKNHALIRVLAVGLNPTDYKMSTHYPHPGAMVGCDFCGIIEKLSDLAESDASSPAGRLSVGTRVCGGVFPYAGSEDCSSGAFAEWVVADARLLLRVPDPWTDLQAAALGSVGWGTVGLAISDPDALNLQGLPSLASAKKEPVLVYGGATASGTMACQLLRLAGYSPIAVTSIMSAALAVDYGAVGAAAYTSLRCSEEIQDLAGGVPIRHALDCITNAESSGTCFAAIARTGGRYACLEGLPEEWRTRRAVRVKVVMGFEGLGATVDLGPSGSIYSRQANANLFEICTRWHGEVQSLIDADLLKSHPVREVPGRWQGIIDGLEMLRRGEVRGQKLVVNIAKAS